MKDANCLDPAAHEISYRAALWLTRREVSPQDTPSIFSTRANNSPWLMTVAEPARVLGKSDSGPARFWAWESKGRKKQPRVIKAIENRSNTSSTDFMFPDCALFQPQSPRFCFDFPIREQLRR
jgi:hypothetical protein